MAEIDAMYLASASRSVQVFTEWLMRGGVQVSDLTPAAAALAIPSVLMLLILGALTRLVAGKLFGKNGGDTMRRVFHTEVLCAGHLALFVAGLLANAAFASPSQSAVTIPLLGDVARDYFFKAYFLAEVVMASIVMLQKLLQFSFATMFWSACKVAFILVVLDKGYLHAAVSALMVANLAATFEHGAVAVCSIGARGFQLYVTALYSMVFAACKIGFPLKLCVSWLTSLSTERTVWILAGEAFVALAILRNVVVLAALLVVVRNAWVYRHTDIDASKSRIYTLKSWYWLLGEVTEMATSVEKQAQQTVLDAFKPETMTVNDALTRVVAQIEAAFHHIWKQFDPRWIRRIQYFNSAQLAHLSRLNSAANSRAQTPVQQQNSPKDGASGAAAEDSPSGSGTRAPSQPVDLDAVPAAVRTDEAEDEELRNLPDSPTHGDAKAADAAPATGKAGGKGKSGKKAAAAAAAAAASAASDAKKSQKTEQPVEESLEAPKLTVTAASPMKKGGAEAPGSGKKGKKKGKQGGRAEEAPKVDEASAETSKAAQSSMSGEEKLDEQKSELTLTDEIESTAEVDMHGMIIVYFDLGNGPLDLPSVVELMNASRAYYGFVEVCPPPVHLRLLLYYLPPDFTRDGPTAEEYYPVPAPLGKLALGTMVAASSLGGYLAVSNGLLVK